MSNVIQPTIFYWDKREQQIKAPSIDNRPIRYSQRFYCETCRRWHSHGMGKGWRASHCPNRDSYYLQPAEADAKLIEALGLPL